MRYLILLLCLVGCVEGKNQLGRLHVESIEGHRYVYVKAWGEAEVGGVVHAESCPCKQ